MCTVLGCKGVDFASGLCSKHYNRLRTTGSTDDGPRARGSLEERLWRNVIVGKPDDCWPWIGKSVVKGYGTLGTGGRDAKKILAHRAAWIVTHGALPDVPGHHGAVVMHTCDNRLCCNPRHLTVGTQGQNVTDMDVKGRRINAQLSAEKHPNAKFTNEQVKAIREDSRSNAEVARHYGVPRQTIRYIRKSGWKSLI